LLSASVKSELLNKSQAMYKLKKQPSFHIKNFVGLKLHIVIPKVCKSFHSRKYVLTGKDL